MARKPFVELGRLGGRARAAKLDSAERSAIASKAARVRWHGLRGIVEAGTVPAARFVVGLKVDAPTENTIPADSEGMITQETGINELFRLRAEQVGPRAAAGTIRQCHGVFQGEAQSTIECEIANYHVPGEATYTTWYEHMLDLGERVADRFGQQEVWIWFGPKLVRASAPGRPVPGPRMPGDKVVR